MQVEPVTAFLSRLPERLVVAIAGADRLRFLQGLVSNDVAQATNGSLLWSALLTPQGRWTADFFLFAEAERILLDVEAAQAELVVASLSRFRLRAQVTLSIEPGWAVFAATGNLSGAHPGLLAFPDPRLAELGSRLYAPPGVELPNATGIEAWDRLRLAHGIPDGSRDLEPNRTLLLEAGFDELGGISWTKGCWMGQELTARTRYRGLVKRRLFPVAADQALPSPGTAVTSGGTEIGDLRSCREGLGLAMLRLDGLVGQSEPPTLRCGEATLRVRQPSWMRIASAKETTLVETGQIVTLA